MKLVGFEREAVAYLLNYSSQHAITPASLSACSVTSYKHTSSGYFIEFSRKDLLFEKKTWYEPVVFGRENGLEVGFILYTDVNSMTLECHSWGVTDVPVNVRELNLIVTTG